MNKKLLLEKMVLYGDSWYEKNDSIIMASTLTNGLFEINRITNEVSLIGKFPDWGLTTSGIAAKCVRYKDMLIFSPNRDFRIPIIDLNTYSITYCEISEEQVAECNTIGNLCLWDIALVDHFVFFFGVQIDVIIKMDLCTQSRLVIKNASGITDVEKLKFDEGEYYYYAGNHAIVDDYLFLPVGTGCEFVRVNTLNNTADIVSYKTANIGHKFIAALGDNLWFTIEGNLYCVNTNTQEMLHIPGVKDKWCMPVVYDKKIILLPYHEDGKAYVLDTTTNVFVLCKELDSLFYTDAGERCVVHGYALKGHILSFVRTKDWKYVSYDVLSNTKTVYEYRISDLDYIDAYVKEWNKEYFVGKIRKNEALREEDLNVQEYIEFMCE